MLVACYGSLKKGHYNHRMLGEDAKFLGESKVHGVMYSNGSYPKLYKVENDDYDSPFRLPLEKKHVIEIYDINEVAFRRITNMELGAGYEAEEMLFKLDKRSLTGVRDVVATIYWMPHKNFDIDDKWVKEY